MSDVALVALFGAASAATVAIMGAIATVFGPAWRERVALRHQRDLEAERARFECALVFVDQLTNYTTNRVSAQRLAVHRARNALVASLREGEVVVAIYTSNAIRTVEESTHSESVEKVDVVANHLFAYLRGELRKAAIWAITTNDERFLRGELRDVNYKND